MVRIIDADNTVRTICGYYCGCERDECVSDDPCEAVTFIEYAPAISPDDVRGVGKWIALDFTDEAYGIVYKCSKCGCEVIGKPDYCEGCGAKMEVE